MPAMLLFCGSTWGSATKVFRSGSSSTTSFNRAVSGRVTGSPCTEEIMRFIILSFSLAAGLLAQRFYSDDPLEREPAPVPLSQAASRKLSDYYDLFSNQFHEVGERQPKSGPRIPAKGVNTLGEPMEGSWWQKRHYYHRMTRDDLMLGPGQKFPPSKKGKWSVV